MPGIPVSTQRINSWKASIIFLVLIRLVLFSGCTNPDSAITALPTDLSSSTRMENTPLPDLSQEKTILNYAPFTSDTLVIDVVNHPAFERFGRYIFPIKNRSSVDHGMKLTIINSLLPYHSAIHTETTVEVLNYMLDEVRKGQTIFYDIYTTEAKKATPGKEDTGIFFFRGKPGAPFAVVNAGGGFSYVGSIHESFPIALELSKKGYNAFSIEYRLGGAQLAYEDLAAALSVIFKNAEALNVSTDGYSLWGSSAGARMAASLGSYGAIAYGGDDLPRPAAIIMLYTGHSGFTVNDPPTFACIGENDGIVSPQTMERRIKALQNLGIKTEFHIFPNLGHGFSLGIGTSAESWMTDAIAFWEANK